MRMFIYWILPLCFQPGVDHARMDKPPEVLNAELHIPTTVNSTTATSTEDEKLVTTLNWVGAYPFFLTNNACGVNACYILLRLLGKEVRYEQLKMQIPLSEQGASLAQLAEALRHYGLEAVCIKARPALFDANSFPCIVHTEPASKDDLGHFYVALRRTEHNLILEDPTTQTVLEMEWTSFLEIWSGNAVIIQNAGISPPKGTTDLQVILCWLSLSILGAGFAWQGQQLWKEALCFTA